MGDDSVWSIASTDTDQDMTAIRTALGGPKTAGGAHELRAHLQARMEPVGVLDLVGHSAGKECFLVLGEWHLDASHHTQHVFRDLLRPELDRLGVKKLRILGCSTAVTTAGWAALTAIYHALGGKVEVFGTLRAIHAPDFSPPPYHGGNLAGTKHGPAGGHGEHGGRGRLPDSARIAAALTRASLLREEFARLATGTCQRCLPGADVRAAIWDQFVPEPAWSMPGLLAQPLVEILVPGTFETVSRIQALLGYEVVRVFTDRYPVGGELYRVRNPDALEALLQVAGASTTHRNPSS